jgi:hypothetical protein
VGRIAQPQRKWFKPWPSGWAFRWRSALSLGGDFTLRPLNAAKTDQGSLPLALPARRSARVLPGLPRRQPALYPRPVRSRRPLPPARLIGRQDMDAALSIASARGYNLGVLSELLLPAELGTGEAVARPAV